MRRHTTRWCQPLLLAGPLALGTLAGCSGQHHASVNQRAPIALGAGDAVGAQLRANHIILTGRTAWDRDRVIAAEAVRLAEALNTTPSFTHSRRAATAVPTSVVSEPVPID